MQIGIAPIASFASAVAAGILALVQLLRPRRSLAHWTFVVGMAVLAIGAACDGGTFRATTWGKVGEWQQWRLIAASVVPGIWLLFSFSYARGGARQFVSRRLWTAALTLMLLPVFAVLFREHLVSGIRLNNADGRWIVTLGWAGMVVLASLMVASVLVVMNLERTFRAAVGTMRWRIKFMLLGVGVVFVVRIYVCSQALIYRGIDPQMGLLNSAALIIAAALIVKSFMRTREFEVDVYPSQSVLQSSVTVVLAGIYLVVVGALAKVAAYLGGDNAFALKAFIALVALVALAVMLQSDRVRLHLRRFVSRNFQRPLFDYRTVWRKFTEGTASRVERTDLCRSLVKLTGDTFQSLSVAIWLLDDKREALALAASTFLPDDSKGPALQNAEMAIMTNTLLAHPEPSDFETVAAAWASALRDVHPSQFANGGHRVCVPLVSQGELIGVMTLGDRVGGTAFNVQDFDMLKCVGDHAAAGLRNVQLSQKLLQAKELEAFQTMAAFFVHDLKNAASTLNLMLQNLPVHFDDPAFREDSLRGISKTVTHINRLIGRLSLLRHEQNIQASEMDLNEVVTAAIAGLEQGVGSRLSKDLLQLPKVMMDREQMTKVVTNLVLNAVEAVAESGSVRIETRQEGEWAVLAISDDGCGMSAEFLATGLFRPFQTTKKNGLGIGMFQSKMIVEGHGGRIAVASDLGKGTTFEVFLPLRAKSR
jgi:putative PEP-CTERM system histidine kinase